MQSCLVWSTVNHHSTPITQVKLKLQCPWARSLTSIKTRWMRDIWSEVLTFWRTRYVHAVKCSHIALVTGVDQCFSPLCHSTRNWWKARFMKRWHQPATLKMTSATPWRTASFTSKTPLTTCVCLSARLWVILRKTYSQCVVEYYWNVCLCDLQTWTPHYFVLTSNKIYYSEETSHYQTADEEEDEEGKEVGRWWRWPELVMLMQFFFTLSCNSSGV